MSYIVCFERRANTRAANVKDRSEEHTSELQSLAYLVCRLLLEKKKKKKILSDREITPVKRKYFRHWRSRLLWVVTTFDISIKYSRQISRAHKCRRDLRSRLRTS